MTDRPPVRDDLVELPGYHSPQIDVPTRLNTNESPDPPPEAFSAAIAEKLGALEWNRYPDRNATDLRSRIAEHHNVDIENIFVANGSNEVLQTILLAWGGPGRSALTFEPTYAMHAQIARVTGTRVTEIDRESDYTIDLDRARSALAEHTPVVTFLCSPNNPTGLVEPRGLVESVLEVVSPFGLLVVDEAYAQFSNWSALELFDADCPAGH